MHWHFSPLQSLPHVLHPVFHNGYYQKRFRQTDTHPAVRYPHFDWWDDSRIQPGGKKVEQGFEYSSGKNTEWLSVDDIAERLKNVKEH